MPLHSMTAGDNEAAQHARDVAARYGLSITGEVNTLPENVLIIATIGAVSLALVALITLVPTGIFSLSVATWLLLTMAVWSPVVGAALSRLFVVSVPKLTGLITTNDFSGVLHVYGPGWHIRKPWEKFTMDDYIDTRALVVAKSSRFITKDGIGITFNWTRQYGPDLRFLPLYVRTEESAIDKGYQEVVENSIQESLTGQNASDILKADVVSILQKNIETRLETKTDTLGSKLEERFGLNDELGTIGPPKYDTDYEEALTAKVVRGLITRDAKAMAKSLNMPEEKAAKLIMILNKENVSEQIITLQADSELATLAPVLVRVLKDAGDAARATQKVKQGGKKGGAKPTPTPPAPPTSTDHP